MIRAFLSFIVSPLFRGEALSLPRLHKLLKKVKVMIIMAAKM